MGFLGRSTSVEFGGCVIPEIPCGEGETGEIVECCVCSEVSCGAGVMAVCCSFTFHDNNSFSGHFKRLDLVSVEV